MRVEIIYKSVKSWGHLGFLERGNLRKEEGVDIEKGDKAKCLTRNLISLKSVIKNKMPNPVKTLRFKFEARMARVLLMEITQKVTTRRSRGDQEVYH